jgi:hypothetical protein
MQLRARALLAVKCEHGEREDAYAVRLSIPPELRLAGEKSSQDQRQVALGKSHILFNFTFYE